LFASVGLDLYVAQKIAEAPDLLIEERARIRVSKEE
jgi:hypothetical protein